MLTELADSCINKGELFILTSLPSMKIYIRHITECWNCRLQVFVPVIPNDTQSSVRISIIDWT